VPLAGRRQFLSLAGVLFPLLTAAGSASPSPAPPIISAQPSALLHPFKAGERLTFAVHWFTVRAGTAAMEVNDAGTMDGRPMLHILTTARSSSMISKIYPVDNRVESTVDADTLLPSRMIFRRREGKRKNDFDVAFHQKEGTVTVNKDDKTETLTMPIGTHDAISCLYYFRSLPALEPGQSIFLNVHHDKKNYRLEVQVEGYETIAGPWGDVKTIRVLAIMPFQGIFLNEGNIRVWLTHDARRLPVLMKAKVVIGSVTARLIEPLPAPHTP
jgi:hypothetical protein